VRRLTRFPPALRISFALRGTLVRSPLRFAFNELRPGRVTAAYCLKDHDVSIVVRHHTPDVLVLDEIFSQAEYDLPPAVKDALSESGPLRIVDLGANIGLFGAYAFTRYPDASILAIEPDPANAAVHARAIDANRCKRWELIEAAAATASGTMRFVSGGFTLSHTAGATETGIEVPTVDVLPHVESADFVKIDIEGAEWALLADVRFPETKARAIVLEYHPEGCLGADPAGEARKALVRAGFQVATGSAKPQYRAGVLWGWRQRQAQSIP
jgi:FkbM family methyltransferase